MLQLLELEVAVPGLVEGLNLDPQQVAAAQARCSLREWEDARDSRLALRGRNGLTLAADVYNAGAEYRMQVRMGGCGGVRSLSIICLYLLGVQPYVCQPCVSFFKVETKDMPRKEAI
eukprot:scaffold205955_cov19-Tisochrysis_lutea.AAC.1